MTVYVGDRTIDGLVIQRDGLPFRLGIEQPAGLEPDLDWGFVGQPSRQLSFALLRDHLRDAERARRLVEGFTVHITANMDNEWELSSEDLEMIVKRLEMA